LTQLNRDLTASYSKVDLGYIQATINPNTWTFVEVPLNGKLNNITATNVSTYALNICRIYAPVVSAFAPDKIVVAIYSVESVAVSIGIYAYAYGY